MVGTKTLEGNFLHAYECVCMITIQAHTHTHTHTVKRATAFHGCVVVILVLRAFTTSAAVVVGVLN